MKAYCPQCGADRQMEMVNKRESYKVRGEEISLDVTVPVCPSCGEVVSIPSVDDSILDEVYRLYRDRKGLLQPEEIKSLRGKYGLSQRALARLMGWGLITIQRYEAGNLQNAAHDTLLRRLDDPGFVLEMLARNGAKLPPKEREAIKGAALGRLETTASDDLAAAFERWMERQARSNPSLVGWQDFSLDRVAHVIAWLHERVKGLMKTKLAKMLWLADFGNFREHRRSMMGLAYARGTHGPMPDRFQALLGVLEAVGYIQLEPVTFANGEGEVVRPLVKFEAGVLTEEEVAILERVKKHYGSLSGRQLSDMSHKDPAWADRKDGELIPYPEADKSPSIEALFS